MKKTIVPTAETARQPTSVSSSWGSQPVQLRPAHGYLTVPLPDSHDPSAFLLCDPLTGLVAYPSFEAHMIAALPGLASDGLHLAIGDVDDLRGYVTAANANDPTLFGHLAGNDCAVLDLRAGNLASAFASSASSDIRHECRREQFGMQGRNAVGRMASDDWQMSHAYSPRGGQAKHLHLRIDGQGRCSKTTSAAHST